MNVNLLSKTSCACSKEVAGSSLYQNHSINEVLHHTKLRTSKFQPVQSRVLKQTTHNDISKIRRPQHFLKVPQSSHTVLSRILTVPFENPSVCSQHSTKKLQAERISNQLLSTTKSTEIKPGLQIHKLPPGILWLPPFHNQLFLNSSPKCVPQDSKRCEPREESTVPHIMVDVTSVSNL